MVCAEDLTPVQSVQTDVHCPMVIWTQYSKECPRFPNQGSAKRQHFSRIILRKFASAVVQEPPNCTSVQLGQRIYRYKKLQVSEKHHQSKYSFCNTQAAKQKQCGFYADLLAQPVPRKCAGISQQNISTQDHSRCLAFSDYGYWKTRQRIFWRKIGASWTKTENVGVQTANTGSAAMSAAWPFIRKPLALARFRCSFMFERAMARQPVFIVKWGLFAKLSTNELCAEIVYKQMVQFWFEIWFTVRFKLPPERANSVIIIISFILSNIFHQTNPTEPDQIFSDSVWTEEKRSFKPTRVI